LLRGRGRFGWRVFWQLYQDYPLVLIKPDLLHIEFGAIAAQRTYLKDLLDCRLVISFRGYDLYCTGLEQPAYYQEVWDRSDALHFLGEDLWEQAQSRGCPGDKPHALISPAIDTTSFDPGGTRSAGLDAGMARPLRVLSVGRLEWKKGYEYSLLAVRQLAERGVACEYRIIGDGDFFEALTFARKELNLEGMVSFLGSQDQAAVKEHLLWADVFLHGAVTEGFCNAVIEAQAMGLPVVCTDAGGLAENVADGETGFVVPRRDPRALAEKMTLLLDPALRQQMGQAGRERVVNRYRIQDQVSKFSDLYRQVLSTPG
jgi:colanic acid/amylovoran biosynthesis glycosyltransferase